MDEKTLEKLSQEFFTLLMLLHKKVLKPDEFIKGLPMPPSHCKVIFYLAQRGATSISTIAKDLCISKPNMTPIIDKLISAGYVIRYEDPNDRRVLMIEVTEKAHEAFKLKKEYVLKSLKELLSTLEDDDLESLGEVIGVFNKVISNLK